MRRFTDLHVLQSGFRPNSGPTTGTTATQAREFLIAVWHFPVCDMGSFWRIRTFKSLFYFGAASARHSV